MRQNYWHKGEFSYKAPKGYKIIGSVAQPTMTTVRGEKVRARIYLVIKWDRPESLRKSDGLVMVKAIEKDGREAWSWAPRYVHQELLLEALITFDSYFAKEVAKAKCRFLTKLAEVL